MINAQRALIWLFRAMFVLCVASTAIGVGVVTLILTGHVGGSAWILGGVTVADATAALVSWSLLRGVTKDQRR